MTKEIQNQDISDEESMQIELGERLHSLRIATGLRIEELASIVGIDAKTIDNLEIGRDEIDFKILNKLSSFYDKKLRICMD